jgi:ribosomal protein S18 acetylase RimI-like enzyme
MVIRSFCLSDYVSVSALFERALSEDCYSETKVAFARQLYWDSELVMVAEQDGAVVGSIIGTIHNNEGFFYRVAVDEEFRHRGIGKSLIQALQNRFSQRNIEKVSVPMDRHNEQVKGLYAALGLEQSLNPRKTDYLKIVSGT